MPSSLWIASGLASLALLQPPALLLVCYRTLARLFLPVSLSAFAHYSFSTARGLLLSPHCISNLSRPHTVSEPLESYTTKMAIAKPRDAAAVLKICFAGK